MTFFALSFSSKCWKFMNRNQRKSNLINNDRKHRHLLEELIHHKILTKNVNLHFLLHYQIKGCISFNFKSDRHFCSHVHHNSLLKQQSLFFHSTKTFFVLKLNIGSFPRNYPFVYYIVVCVWFNTLES